MGVFKLFGAKAKNPQKNIVAELARERGDYKSYFYLSHKDEIDTWKHLITTSRQAMTGNYSLEQKLGILNESKSFIDGFHDWCAEKEYGEEYFQFVYNSGDRSMVNRILEEKSIIEKTLYIIIPRIMSCDGELQSEFVKKLSVEENVPDYIIRDQIYELEKEGLIRKEKDGRSYRIYKCD